MKNPVDSILEERKMSVADLAVLAGVSVSQVHQQRLGYSSNLSKRVLDAMVRLGYERQQMIRLYVEWREERAGALQIRYQA